MSEAAGAGAVLDVEDHVVILIRRDAHGHCVQPKTMAHLPCADVAGTRAVSADAKSPDDFSLARIKCEPATEYDDSADRFTYHRIVLLSVSFCGAGESSRTIRRGGRCKAVEALSWLRRGVEVR